MTNLFKTGFYKLHSGEFSNFKIDCDALTDEDIHTIALQLIQRLPHFSAVEWIPNGGMRLAAALEQYITPFQPIRSESILIVDDVFTTGASMEEKRDFRTGVFGAVIFARSKPPAWITPLFTVTS